MGWDKVQQGWDKVSGTTREAWNNLARGGIGILRGDRVDSERSRTNESLRVERAKVDEALAARVEVVAKQADAVVDLARDDADAVLSAARESADAVLHAAREKADEAAEAGTGSVEPQAGVVEERMLADEAVREERGSADEALRLQREEYARSLNRYLPQERDSTDSYLRSERKRSDDALANMDDFLAIVAHDLRDLLGGVALSAKLLSKKAPTTEDGAATVVEAMRIERNVVRMNRLIGDLLDVASIDAGKLAVVPVMHDLGALLAEVEDRFRATALAKKISMQARPAAGPLPVAFDHDRIYQVLANLIMNSLKFTPEGGSIALHAERDAGNVCISVVDTGTGIPEDALEVIFDRFSQVGKNDRRGLGLGLFISRRIVEEHGGKIWAESKPGAGSRISFTLPAQAGP
jgi:signal transduction histidine kinase